MYGPGHYIRRVQVTIYDPAPCICITRVTMFIWLGQVTILWPYSIMAQVSMYGPDDYICMAQVAVLVGYFAKLSRRPNFQVHYCKNKK